MYQRRPPERGEVVLKAPNMILLWLILMLHSWTGRDHGGSDAEMIRPGSLAYFANYQGISSQK